MMEQFIYFQLGVEIPRRLIHSFPIQHSMLDVRCSMFIFSTPPAQKQISAYALAVVRHMADHMGVMYLGRLCEMAPVDNIFDNPLHPHTRMLLETIPDVEMTGRKTAPVAGQIPNPIDPPSSCAFHPRCPHVFADCRKIIPELMTLKSGVQVACHTLTQDDNRPSESNRS